MKKVTLTLSLTLLAGFQLLHTMEDPFNIEYRTTHELTPRPAGLSYELAPMATRKIAFPRQEHATWTTVTSQIRSSLHLDPEEEIHVYSEYYVSTDLPSVGIWIPVGTVRRLGTKCLKFEASTTRPPATEALWQEAIHNNTFIQITIPSRKHILSLPEGIATDSRTPHIIVTLPTEIHAFSFPISWGTEETRKKALRRL